jgi:hypothetical protein
MKSVPLIAAILTMTAFCGCKSYGHHNGMIKEKAMGNCPSGIVDTNCAENAKCHAKKISGEMEKLLNHLRTDSEEVSDPQAKAMFETSAEVLAGLVKAFDDYERETEKAWNK